MMKETPKFDGDILAIGFGTTAAMWTAGYLLRIPPALAPGWLLSLLLLILLFSGGYAAGKFTSRGWKGGLWASLLTSLLNLLILGSVISGDSPNELRPSAMIWIPGSFLISAILGSIGGMLGARKYNPEINPPWSGIFALVASCTTLLLLVTGGIVTSQDAGLAVVDWPNSYQYNMFLYPLAKMTGGIYYEHSHRLIGFLVGVTTVTLAIYLFLTDDRKWMRKLLWLVMFLVAVQAFLGGLRVTGFITLSDSADVTRPSLILAMVHAVLGQIFFGLMITLAVFTSRGWLNKHEARHRDSTDIDRIMSVVLIFVVLLQIITGVLLRHTGMPWHLHVTLALVVFGFALVTGLRCWGIYPDIAVLRKYGVALMGTVTLQVILGISALIVVNMYAESAERPSVEVFFATAHQAVGAILLAKSIAISLWIHRLLPKPDSAD